MPTFHDMWMDAWRETDAAGEHVQALRMRLAEARELIDEDNPSRTRQQGGEIVRQVRQECRRITGPTA